MCAIAVFAIGCTDVRNGQPPTESERLLARQLADQVHAVRALSIYPDSSVHLVASATLPPVVGLLAPEAPIVHPPEHEGRFLDGCLTRTASTATYTECEVGKHVLQGSMAALGDRVQAELIDVFILGPSQHGTVNVDAHITRGANMSGTMELDAMWTVGEVEQVLDAEVRVDGLTFDASGCAVGGTITLTGDLGRPPSNSTARISRTLWFGPQCGDLLVSR
jgi:hypothetical protein